MRYSIKSGAIEKVAADCLVVLSVQSTPSAKQVIWIKSRESAGAVIKSGDFNGKLGETSLLYKTGVSARDSAGGRRTQEAQCPRGAKVEVDRQAVAKTQFSTHYAMASVEITDRDASWLAARLAQEPEDACYR